jgi:putative transposase
MMLRMKIRNYAESRVHYGYQRIHILLKREGFQINHKRVYRLYCLENLHLRSKKSKKRVSMPLAEIENVSRINESWAMDFVSDQLFNGKRFRALTLVDIYSRECLAIYPAQSIKAQEVVSNLEIVTRSRDSPDFIRVDNGPEFISKALDFWAYQNGVKLQFSRPGNRLIMLL